MAKISWLASIFKCFGLFPEIPGRMNIQRIYLYYIFQFQTTCLIVLHRTKLWDDSAEIIADCISELP